MPPPLEVPVATCIDPVDGINLIFYLASSLIRTAGHQRDAGAGLTAHLDGTSGMLGLKATRRSLTWGFALTRLPERP